MKLARLEPLAAVIRKAREDAGLSQKELAKLLGVTQAAVSNWETAESRPGVVRIRALAEALGIDDAELTSAAELTRG